MLVSTPVPASATLCGDPGASLVTLSVPVATPTATGVKAAPSVQFAFAARLDGQSLVCVKGPSAWVDWIESGAVPLLVSLTMRGAAISPTATLPNATEL